MIGKSPLLNRRRRGPIGIGLLSGLLLVGCAGGGLVQAPPSNIYDRAIPPDSIVYEIETPNYSSYYGGLVYTAAVQFVGRNGQYHQPPIINPNLNSIVDAGNTYYVQFIDSAGYEEIGASPEGLITNASPVVLLNTLNMSLVSVDGANANLYYIAFVTAAESYVFEKNLNSGQITVQPTPNYSALNPTPTGVAIIQNGAAESLVVNGKTVANLPSTDFEGSTSSLYQTGFSRDGTKLAVVRTNFNYVSTSVGLSDVHVYEVKSGKLLLGYTDSVQAGAINSWVFSPDGNDLAISFTGIGIADMPINGNGSFNVLLPVTDPNASVAVLDWTKPRQLIPGIYFAQFF